MHSLYSVIFLTKIYQSSNTPCLSTPCGIHPGIFAQFFTCRLYNLVYPSGNVPSWYSPVIFWHSTRWIVILSRWYHLDSPWCLLGSHLDHKCPRWLFSNSRVKFLEYGRLVFIYFYQLMMKWEPLSKPSGWRFSRVIIRDHHMFTIFGIAKISGQR